MIFFRKKTGSQYLVTNYKVMFSTLVEQDSLVKVNLSAALILELLLSRVGLNKSKFYLITRNPYSRLESFFKNKFRSTIPTINKTKKWQHCHEIFFPYLGLSSDTSPTLVSKRLLLVTFPEFISLLPVTYKQDGHLYPQNWTKSLHLGKFYIGVQLPIKFFSKFKMESKVDLKKMKDIFDLDLKIVQNSTTSINESIKWTNRDYEIVNLLYHTDFTALKYERILNEKVKD